MRTTSKNSLAQALRAAIRESGLSMRQVSLRTGLGYQSVWGFLAGGDLALRNASRIAELLGLELRPVGRKRKDG
ncbi:MAG: hypothetical protein HY763_14595 [Planctomycetes bacterium]|nr:hypothetical protein [Planctomycetota bacterium]